MKIGYQTIIWGPRIDDLPRVLDTLVSHGYKGIEFCQRPDQLGTCRGGRFRPVSYRTLLEMLAERKLSLIGLSGGTFQERVRYCEGYKPPAYYYVENWDDELDMLARVKGATAALHLNAFTSIRKMADAERLLLKYKRLKLLPDTAHMYIGGDKFGHAIRAYARRLAAVHLKDWTPLHGRSSHRYARGFTELGQGDVPLSDIIDELRGIDYRGWVVVEQDCTRSDPAHSLRASSEWLQEHKLLPNKPRRLLGAVPDRARSFPLGTARCSPEAELGFIRDIYEAARQDFGNCYDRIAKSFKKLVPSKLVTVWAFSPSQQRLSLLTLTEPTNLTRHVTEVAQSLSGIAIDRRVVTRFDLQAPQPGLPFGRPDAKVAFPELVSLKKLGSMISIPILNPNNTHQVRFLVNIFPRSQEIDISDEQLAWLGLDMAYATDGMLDERCLHAARLTHRLVSRSKLLAQFARNFAELVREVIGCEGATILLVNKARQRLEVAGTTGLTWTTPDGQHFYEKGQGLTGAVWERGEILLTDNTRAEPGNAERSMELVKTDQFTCMIAPMITGSGQVIGVVRSRNKNIDRHGGFNIMTDDDAAVLDAMIGPAVSHIRRLQAEQWRSGQSVHDLFAPICRIRANVDALRSEDSNGMNHSWQTMLSGIDESAKLILWRIKAAKTAGLAEVAADWDDIDLYKDIVLPVIGFVAPLLEAQELPYDRIVAGPFDAPPWRGHREQMQVAVFAILSNAIRYADTTTKRFQIEVEGRTIGQSVRISVRDNGVGIPGGFEEMIFEEGIRGPGAVDRSPDGQGVGLAEAKQIIEAHGGRIALISPREPTEFAIVLPLAAQQGNVVKQKFKEAAL